VSYAPRVHVRPDPTSVWEIVSRREARLVFWLIVIALVAFIVTVSAGSLAPLAGPAVILFVAWLLAYVLEPPVSWLQRHLPTRGRGIPVAITYLVTAVIAIVVLASAGIALLRAAIEFVERLPEIVARVTELLAPIVEGLEIELPTGGDLLTAIADSLRAYGADLADAVATIVQNAIAVIAGLVTAVFISVGLAVGQVSLLGWLRRFLPSSTYRDLTELERAIAVSFGGFVRGRLLIGAIFGGIVAISAWLLGVPLAPLIGVIAGLIVFIPWIGPLIGWAVLPAFALVLAPDAVVPSLIISVIAAVAVQLVVTQLVMGAAVNMSPVAVFVVVILGTSIAGIMGAIFAIPVAAAILAITDYLRQRDVLLRSTGGDGAPLDPLEPVTGPAPSA
jgi:predicted PurR-regulated permease PerM